jgi:hypothetical protein
MSFNAAGFSSARRRPPGAGAIGWARVNAEIDKKRAKATAKAPALGMPG